MTKLVLSSALVIAGISAVTLTVLHFPRVQVAVQRAVSPGQLSPKHTYLADRCASCHDPNHGVAVAKCTACHANSERLLGRQPTAFHASIGECSTCHIEHLQSGIRPPKMDHVALARVGARTLERAAPADRRIGSDGQLADADRARGHHADRPRLGPRHREGSVADPRTVAQRADRAAVARQAVADRARDRGRRRGRRDLRLRHDVGCRKLA